MHPVAAIFGFTQTRLGAVSCAVAVLLLLQAVAAAVYLAGGTANALPHLAYVPIILGAAAFGWRGGLAVAVLAGLALGPWMPQDVARGVAQPTAGWLLRLALFALIGGLAGGLFSAVRTLVAALEKAGFQSVQSGLPNQQALLRRLRVLREGAAAGQPVCGLILFELTRYQDILSTFGARHAMVVARSVARRLGEVRPADADLFELPGGIMAYVLRRPTAERLEQVATQTVGLLDAERVVVHTTLPMEVRAGVSPPLDARHRPLEVLRIGHAALMAARARRSQIAGYDDAMTAQWRRAALLLGALRTALDDPRQLHLAYQPKIELKTGRCTGAEALIRWRHPSLGNVSPAEFIPIVERSALVDRFTLWVVEQALAQLRRWHEAGERIEVSVNVSIRNLEHPHFATHVLTLLRQSGLPPGALEIEVTEGAFMRYADQCRDTLAELREAGLGVALDDFGTGHSSLSILRDLPLTMVKLDRSFIANFGDAGGNVTILPLLHTLLHRLGLRVTAEGVETGETASRLTAWGCEYGQGYLWAKPMPADDFTAWLAAHRAQARQRPPGTGPA